MSFEDFARAVCRIPDYDANVHFKAQVRFIKDTKGRVIPDFIGRFESLGSDFEKVCTRVGLEGQSLAHLQASEHAPYAEYYTNKLRTLVAKRYAEDIRCFGYKF